MYYTGSDIEEHIHHITLKYMRPYVKLADMLANAVLPLPPDEWRMDAGWTRYDRDGTVTSVAYPSDMALVFDVETLVSNNYPIMATAASERAW